jgi:Na+/proline symporter
MANGVAANTRRLRTWALVLAGAGTLFWLYTFYGIAQVPAGDGSGFQWLAVMPLGMVFFALTFPALILAVLDKAPRFALGLGVAGLIAFAWIWNELLQEFYH